MKISHKKFDKKIRGQMFKNITEIEQFLHKSGVNFTKYEVIPLKRVYFSCKIDNYSHIYVAEIVKNEQTRVITYHIV